MIRTRIAFWFTWSRWVTRARFFRQPEKYLSGKPIIVIKAGRSGKPPLRYAASHTVPSPGMIEVLDSTFRRCGVLRACTTLPTSPTWPETLSKQPET